MSVPTRILGASALALVVLLLIAVSAHAAGAQCLPAAVWMAEAQAKSATVVEWHGEQAGIVFAEMALAGLAVAGDSILVVPTAFGVMVGVVDDGQICSVLPLPIEKWRALRIMVEGSPL